MALISAGGGGGEPTILTFTVPANSTLDTGISPECYVNSFAIIPDPGLVLNRVGTIDPTSVSTGDANLINNTLTDLTYNNSSAGSANKELPAIDLGSPVLVEQIDLHWWSATYLSNDFRIEASNDGTTWTTVASGLSSTVVGLQEIPVSGTFRYWRVFNISGTNPTWVILSEMYARGASPGNAKKLTSKVEDLDIRQTATPTIELVNNLGTAIDFEVTVAC